MCYKSKKFAGPRIDQDSDLLFGSQSVLINGMRERKDDCAILREKGFHVTSGGVFVGDVEKKKLNVGSQQ
jgi:hypothetical protein